MNHLLRFVFVLSMFYTATFHASATDIVFHRALSAPLSSFGFNTPLAKIAALAIFQTVVYKKLHTEGFKETVAKYSDINATSLKLNLKQHAKNQLFLGLFASTMCLIHFLPLPQPFHLWLSHTYINNPLAVNYGYKMAVLNVFDPHELSLPCEAMYDINKEQCLDNSKVQIRRNVCILFAYITAAAYGLKSSNLIKPILYSVLTPSSLFSAKIAQCIQLPTLPGILANLMLLIGSRWAEEKLQTKYTVAHSALADTSMLFLVSSMVLGFVGVSGPEHVGPLCMSACIGITALLTHRLREACTDCFDLRYSRARVFNTSTRLACFAFIFYTLPYLGLEFAKKGITSY